MRSIASPQHLKLLGLASALLLLAVACVRGLRADVPQQSWWAERGPVVPHDSFPSDCTLCHMGKDWHTIKQDFRFDHLAETGYALIASHQKAECLRCHNDRGPVASFAARGCVGCHEDVHRGTLGQGCESCHNQSDWRANEAVRQHAATRFPLIGTHAATPCWRCHDGAEVGKFSPTPLECEQCHQVDLDRATVPDHQGQGWIVDCERCHVPTFWAGAGFHHPGMPLTGGHAGLDCTACHEVGNWGGLSSDCYSCHSDDYATAQDPDHVAFSFPTDCRQCHNTSTWEGARFDHAGIVDSCVSCHLGEYEATNDPDHVASGFPTDCEQCHNTRAWQDAHFSHQGISSGCVTCHLADYVGTQDPDHEALGYPTTCEDCHGTQDWHGAGFDHTGITTGCVACHLPDYQGTTDPDHEALGFSTECETCHDTSQWQGANFDHAGTSRGCVLCHLPEYEATTDPDHAAAGFPTSCELCHGTRTWNGADFDHQFPIDGGDHGNLDCVECHQNPRNYAIFTCTDCHAHSQNDMDDEHDGIDNYIYQSSACYNCHPNGQD